ncbi:hypothetical protein AB0P21_12740 [Kribbella sp. NPDC056861]|uniref:hypothetical protein n=1 Tax=Kribbella sp. NPDC056861 TaxID=3154857 RepID=UPI00342ACFAD
MRRLILCLATLLVVVGCTSTAATVDDSPTTPTPIPALPLLPADDAKKALLTARDLPWGWLPDAPTTGSPAAPRLGTYQPAECLDLRHPQNDLRAASARTEITFTGPRQQILFETIGSWPTAQQALLQKIDAALARCESFVMTPPDGSEEISFRTRRVPLPDVTDAVAVRFDVVSEGLTDFNVHVVRGGTVLHLRLPEGFDNAEIAQLVSKVVAKYDAVTK